MLGRRCLCACSPLLGVDAETSQVSKGTLYSVPFDTWLVSVASGHGVKGVLGISSCCPWTLKCSHRHVSAFAGTSWI